VASPTYPTHQLLAVIDDPAAAEASARALTDAAFEVTLLRGPDAVAAFRGTGRARGPWTRFVRIFKFMSMDQMPDFVTYEAALREGRAVISVRIRGHATLETARGILLEHGAHFLNWFGRFSTEEVAPWRGAEPNVPGYLRR
jgi:hypothetical protein